MLENPVYPPVLAPVGSSDNPRGAGNQQERLPGKPPQGGMIMALKVKQIPEHIGYYLAGFADGEGSFNVSFRRRRDHRMPWKISPCFNVSQRDRVILALFKRHLGCGTLRQRSDGVWYYEVNNFNAICENVIPFFERFRFLSAKKKRDFAKFRKIVRLMQEGKHLTEEGIREILKIRADMNDGGAGRRKYSDEEILRCFSQEESSETIRQALKGQDNAASPEE
ncbi:MAG: hypothetical protein DRI80_18695 [Chloroflexota bacterium]|nr:MAG: hypothetical protein DRI80_18695 [Chloroflexota bacterium]